MRRRIIASVLAFSLSGCAIPHIPCEALAAEVALCDVAPERLRCDRLEPEALARLAQAVDRDGCDALWDPTTRAVNPSACTAFDWPCPAPRVARSVRATRNPILFVSGIDGRAALDFHEELLSAIEERTGAHVHHVTLPAWSDRAVRASALEDAVRERTANGAERVNLIAYAVGGLDARFLVSPAGLHRDDYHAHSAIVTKIASLTTIGTPHRGTEVAEAALEASRSGQASALLRTFLGGAGTLGLSREVLEELLRDLTLEEAAHFDAEMTMPPDLFVQSVAGVSFALGEPLWFDDEALREACDFASQDLLFSIESVRGRDAHDALSAPLVATMPFAARAGTESGVALNAPSDGMVSVASARFGLFRGCVRADHYDFVGQFVDSGADPRTGFDARELYVELIADLARRGL